MLADKAFRELQEQGQLDNPQVAFNVKQKRPATLIDTVSSTLEMESYLLPCPSKVATESVIAAVHSKQDLMMDMLQGMMERLDRLEKQMCPKSTLTGPSSPTNPIICHKCGQEGHFARGCASRTSRSAPNTNQGTVAVVPVSHSYTVSGSTQGIPTNFIIDTGAAVTLLHKDMWDKLGKLLMPWDGSPLVGVARNPLEVWGSVVVKVEIADGCSICIDS